MPPIPPKFSTKTPIPQLRVLEVLMPVDPSIHWVDWPLLDIVDISTKLGVKRHERPDGTLAPMSGLVTVALRGRSSSPDKGLLEKEYVKTVIIPSEADRVVTSYRITEAGIKAYQRHIAQHGELPPQRKKESCVNDRYQPSTAEE